MENDGPDAEEITQHAEHLDLWRDAVIAMCLTDGVIDSLLDLDANPVLECLCRVKLANVCAAIRMALVAWCVGGGDPIPAADALGVAARELDEVAESADGHPILRFLTLGAEALAQVLSDVMAVAGDPTRDDEDPF